MKTREPLLFFTGMICLSILPLSCKQKTDYYTRDVGIYPGRPAEDYSPNLETDNVTYRNIAKLRPTYQSSSYNYNLTAELVTDGIIINNEPDYISVATSQGVLPAFYNDNYVSLMPGKTKIIKTRLKDEDTEGETPVADISGFNL